MRGARIYLILSLVLFALLAIVFLYSCRSGNDPQSRDDDTDRTTVSALELPDLAAA